MKLAYFPGCSVKATGLGFETSAIAAFEKLGIELEEMPVWNCCGTVYSLTSDNLMFHIAPVRNLIRIQETGADKFTTLCSMCYNTIEQSNRFVRDNPDKLETINAFIDELPDYKGEIDIVHPLELLSEEGLSAKLVKKVKKAKKTLSGLKVAPYYGCMLTRPKGAALDDLEDPSLMEDIFESLGAKVVASPYRVECCGSYHTANRTETVVDRAYRILTYAKNAGADMIVLSCPLCEFNLDDRQKDIVKKYPDFKPIPVVYFTQLLALALGVDKKVCRFEDNYVNPLPVLKRRKIV